MVIASSLKDIKSQITQKKLLLYIKEQLIIKKSNGETIIATRRSWKVVSELFYKKVEQITV